VLIMNNQELPVARPPSIKMGLMDENDYSWKNSGWLSMSWLGRTPKCRQP